MGDYTRWDSGGMTQAEADLRLAYRGIRDELDELERDLRKDLDQWTGTAREAYTDANRKWDAATKQLNHILDTLGLAVKDIHENYSRAERDNQSIFM